MKSARWTPAELAEYRARTLQPENGATVWLKTVRKSPKQRTADAMLQRADDPEMEARFKKALKSIAVDRPLKLNGLPLSKAEMAEQKEILEAAKNQKGFPDLITPQHRTQALGRLPAGKMNKTEATYSNVLQARKMAGEIIWWAFEPINIRLAQNCYYRVDFMVMLAGGQMECHEVKGGAGFKDDALVKIKVASTILPFQFIAMQLVSGEWIRRDF